MRLVVLVCGLLALGCVDRPLISDYENHVWSNPSAGSCPGPIADDGELGCRADTPYGCVCGHGVNIPGVVAGSEGSCHLGACCKGCWDVESETCLPGTDARGWGAYGGTCTH